jgi:hypothetical protein
MTARRAESCYVIARQEEEIGLPSITDRKSRHQLERSILESVEAYLLERLGIPFTLTEYSWVRSQLYLGEIKRRGGTDVPAVDRGFGGRRGAG